jgi:hypothetical protein
MDRDADLPKVVQALRTAGGLSRSLYCREQQGDQYPNDRDHDQQFHQGETKLAVFHASTSGQERMKKMNAAHAPKLADCTDYIETFKSWQSGCQDSARRISGFFFGSFAA